MCTCRVYTEGIMSSNWKTNWIFHNHFLWHEIEPLLNSSTFYVWPAAMSKREMIPKIRKTAACIFLRFVIIKHWITIDFSVLFIYHTFEYVCMIFIHITVKYVFLHHSWCIFIMYILEIKCSIEYSSVIYVHQLKLWRGVTRMEL